MIRNEPPRIMHEMTSSKHYERDLCIQPVENRSSVSPEIIDTRRDERLLPVFLFTINRCYKASINVVLRPGSHLDGKAESGNQSEIAVVGDTFRLLLLSFREFRLASAFPSRYEPGLSGCSFKK